MKGGLLSPSCACDSCQAEDACVLLPDTQVVRVAMASGGGEQGELPEFWHFPPFFTMQPVIETRKMQIKLWREFVLRWHQAKRVQNLNINEWSGFSNLAIDRSLSLEARREVVQNMVSTGHAEWKDDKRLTCLIMWRSPEEIASSIWGFAQKNGMAGGVYTVYELHSGEESTADADFHGTDPVVFRKALQVLEDQGRLAIFDNAGEEGVKFSVA